MSENYPPTLHGKYVGHWERDVGETGDVVLYFGNTEVCRWPVDPMFFRDPEQKAKYVEQFVADKLTGFFGSNQ